VTTGDIAGIGGIGAMKHALYAIVLKKLFVFSI